MNIRRRLGLPRMSFHVMNRGARRANIFGGDDDRRVFVNLLGKYCQKYEVRLTSWCLMSNHYHIEPDAKGTPLSRLMHDLDGTYAKIYNENHSSDGCLFQGPFKSISIGSERGLAYVSRYIHLNPRDMGADPFDYQWSSLGNYLGLEAVPEWLDPMPVLRQFGDSLEEARRNYRFYVESAPPKKRRESHADDPATDFLVNYIGHLEELWAERWNEAGRPPGATALSTFVCWYALRQEKLPPAVLSEYYGYSTPGTVRVLASRFGKRLREEADLAQWLARVNVYATRNR